MSEQMGEVEIKVNDLVEEVFVKYNKPTASANPDDDLLDKEEIRAFIQDIMTAAGEGDAWDDKEFDTCFKEFDYDGSGTVTKAELSNFIKRFAAL